MWTTAARLLTLAVILILVVVHVAWDGLPEKPVTSTASVHVLAPTDVADRPTLFELMDPETASEARPVVVRDPAADEPADEEP